MMTRNKTGMGLSSLLLAGAAAFAYYKYSKMSDEQKDKMLGDLKEKGKKFYDEKVPSSLKNMFHKKAPAMNGYTHSQA
ncbi:hypothetical protein V9K67_24810 [Paraflavisolibacter sp. H34]|uniref:hypothetical protein n=1 Tax=Huijunlia imazamoxiresistens TaxID=3127457 RepID=UPI0030168C27